MILTHVNLDKVSLFLCPGRRSWLKKEEVIQVA